MQNFETKKTGFINILLSISEQNKLGFSFNSRVVENKTYIDR